MFLIKKKRLNERYGVSRVLVIQTRTIAHYRSRRACNLGDCIVRLVRRKAIIRPRRGKSHYERNIREIKGKGSDDCDLRAI